MINVTNSRGLSSVLVIWFLLFFLLGNGKEVKPDYDYGIMMDAGSSGTRLHIYTWPHRKNTSVPFVEPAPIGEVPWSVQITPGLASFANHPGEAVPYIERLMDYAVDKIPENKKGSTPVYLFGTAGFRLLNITAREHILNFVRSTIRRYHFRFEWRWADVINGSMEGVFGWVTVNHLYDAFKTSQLSEDKPTYGALDLGGASTQITFVLSDKQIPEKYFFSMSLAKTTYPLYVWSFLGFGLDQAFATFRELLVSGQRTLIPLIIDPCLPYGKNATQTMANGTTYIVSGSGNYDECKRITQKLFDKTHCINQPSCSFNGTFQPPLPDIDFVAFSGYFYTVSFLNDAFNGTLPEATADGRIRDEKQIRLPLTDVENLAKLYCRLPWSTIVERWGSTAFAKFLDRYCFNAAYIVNILNYGYGFTMDKNNLIFAGSKDQIELGWALGAMIYQENLLQWGYKGAFIGYVIFVLVVSSIIFLTLFASLAYLVVTEINRRSYIPS